MFENKQKFKEEYARRLLETYGVTVESSHITERYAVLGEMVRDYANVDWGRTHDKTIKKQRTLIYFSMEFLIGRLLVNNMQNMGIYEVVKDGLITKAGIYEVGIEGIQEFRVRIESVSGGSATILGRAVSTAN